jgi:PhnB protein
VVMGPCVRRDDNLSFQIDVGLPLPCSSSSRGPKPGAKDMAEPVQIVTPHLVVSDANAAIEFYKKALGATETMRMPAEDGKRLMHSEIRIGGARIFVMDDFPEHRGSHGVDAVFPPDQIKGTSVTMHLEVENCDAAVRRAKDAGATVTLEPWDSFWGDRYARILDPFGHSWSFAHRLPAKG